MAGLKPEVDAPCWLLVARHCEKVIEKLILYKPLFSTNSLLSMWRNHK